MSEGKEIQIKNMTGDKEKLTNRVSIEVNEVIDLQKEYYIVTENQDKIPVGLGGVVRTSEFDETYAYDGKLGALYSKEKNRLCSLGTNSKSS